MTDMLLSRDQLCATMLAPWNWQIVSSLCPPDITPVDGRLHPIALQVAAVHYDPCPQISIFLQGEGVVCIGKTVYPCKPGSVFFVDAFEHHSYHFNDLQSPADLYRINVLHGYYVVRYWPHREGEMIETVSQDDILTDIEAGVLLGKQMEDLRHSTLAPTHVRTRLVAATAVLAGAIAERHLLRRQRERGDFQREVVEAVRRHIVETLDREQTLDDLARVAGYSKYHFARVFRQETGQSVHEYVDTCRLARMGKLEGEGKSQKQIAAALGFSSPTAFAKWRRKQRDRGYSA